MSSKTTIRPYPIKTHADVMDLRHPLAQALISSLAKHHERLRGRRLWLACSGGRDSMALAAVCVALYRQGALPCLPQLLHVDHGMQSVSYDWSIHVQAWATAQGVPCTVLQAHVVGDNEQAARTARYDAMYAHMHQEDVLMLGHHSDDQAETLIMRLIQGAGVQGLAGMQPWRQHRTATGSYQLWRPWLGVRRHDISDYANNQQLPYINDPTNETGDNQRSQLRHHIMPALTALNPQAIDNITRSAALLSDAANTVHAQANADIQHAVVKATDCPPLQRTLSVDRLNSLPIARLRQCLHTWLTLDEPLPPPKQRIDDMVALLQRSDANHQTDVYWQGAHNGYHIRRYQDTLYRLNHAWLTWLTLPIEAQQLVVNDALTQSPQSLTVRTDALCRWQVRVQENAAVISSVHLSALNRQTPIQTTTMAHPQRGKKLYQHLGIPAWLRDSIALLTVTDTAGQTTPIALISPYHVWPIVPDNAAPIDYANDLLIQP